MTVSRTKSAARIRKPAYVSPSTLDATLFLDGAASGNRVTCTVGTGTTGTCTINWSSPTSGSHTFAVEVDDGHTVLAEGAATYVLTAGSNALAPLVLNGVAGSFALVTQTVSATCSGPNPSCYNGVYSVADADFNLIVLPGNVYDNGPLSVAGGTGSTATFGQSFTGNGSGAGGLNGPDASGNDYQFSLWCTPGATGSFTLAFSPHTTSPPAGETTPAELATYSLNYPSGVTALNWPTYYCANGTISTTAPPQTLFVADNNSTVTVYGPPYTGGPTTISNGVVNPGGLAVDSSANLFVDNFNGNTVTEYTPPYTGAPTTINNGVSRPVAIALDGSADLFVANGFNVNTVKEFAPPYTGAPATISNGVSGPRALAFDGLGNLFIANNTGNTVTEYAAPYTGAPTATISSGIATPIALVFDSAGDLFVANTSTVTKYAPPYTGLPTTISTGVSGPGSLALDASGNLFVQNNNSTVTEYAPPYTGVPTTISNGVSGPNALVLDHAGNLFVSNHGNNTVTEYAPPYTGAPVTTISSGVSFPDGLRLTP